MAWNIWETNIIEVIEDWYILSFAYRWADEKEVTVRALPDYPGYKKNPKSDKRLVKDLHKLISRCDILVAHNAPFDTKKSNARFLHHGLKPTPPYRVVDTLAILRKYFKLELEVN